MYKTTVYCGDDSKQIEFNKIEFKKCAKVFDDMPEILANENRQYNRNILSNGVKGFACSYVGKFYFVIPDSYKEFTMPDDCLGYYISSGELYENGFANIYCRNVLTGELLGYILIR